jgi:hypothetical protein
MKILFSQAYNNFCHIPFGNTEYIVDACDSSMATSRILNQEISQILMETKLSIDLHIRNLK